jgi:hypothetical protein
MKPMDLCKLITLSAILDLLLHYLIKIKQRFLSREV